MSDGLAAVRARFDSYVADVLSGEQVACRQVRQACARHVRDVERQEELGIYFDWVAVRAVLRFFEDVLRHSKGKWARQRVVLEPWQVFVLGSIFGWKWRRNGKRRFATAYLEVARKNGKTFLAAGIGLFCLRADGEQGAEVYSAATTLKQAKLCFDEAERMVKQSAMLRGDLRLRQNNISHPVTFSKFEPLSSEHETLDGLNVSLGICDELHAWTDGGMWDVLETGTGSREQPLMIAPTTAGSNLQSLCFTFHDYTEKVLSEAVVDEEWFGIIFTLDMPLTDSTGNVLEPGDDYEDPAVWVKANPNLGVSKSADDLARQVVRTADMPSRLNALLNKHFNIWTQASSRWLSRAHWELCGRHVFSEDDLAGRVCYGGLDLSSKIDLTAWALIFPPIAAGEPWKLLVRSFMPEGNVLKREKEDKVPFTAWERGGWVMLTDGNVVDEDFIIDQIDKDLGRFDVRSIAFDRWGSNSVVQRLVKIGCSVEPEKAKLTGQTVVYEMGQGFVSMSAPAKEFEGLILADSLAHGNNAVLSWMADNVMVRVDPAENIKPDKAKSTERIDGIVASVMALAQAMEHAHEARGSVYGGRGLRVL